VTVPRKSARPRALNVLKPLYRAHVPPREQIREHLLAGRSIGIFPEGAINRDPKRLMRGRRGAARLSLETATSVVPVGIRFLEMEPGQPVPEHAAMELEIGAPLVPPGQARKPASIGAVSEWHAAIMTEIGRLSGKTWIRGTQEADHGRSKSQG
jgi:1-acyl-sn-glycerol-3-phosphate acyltransferase